MGYQFNIFKNYLSKVNRILARLRNDNTEATTTNHQQHVSMRMPKVESSRALLGSQRKEPAFSRREENEPFEIWLTTAPRELGKSNIKLFAYFS